MMFSREVITLKPIIELQRMQSPAFPERVNNAVNCPCPWNSRYMTSIKPDMQLKINYDNKFLDTVFHVVYTTLKFT